MLLRGKGPRPLLREEEEEARETPPSQGPGSPSVDQEQLSQQKQETATGSVQPRTGFHSPSPSSMAGS